MKSKERSYQTMLSTGDVARIFEVYPGTIRRWCAEGRIRSYRSGPHACRRFLREDVAVAYLDRSFQKYFRNHNNHPYASRS